MTTIRLPKREINHVTITPDADGESLLSIDSTTIKRLYKVHGAILFRGFEFDVGVFKSFTESFCTSTVINESQGRKTIDQDAKIQTVNLGAEAFSLHPELSRWPWKPDICFFGCVVPPSSGGETTLCDGVKIVQKMPKKLVRVLQGKRLLYNSIASPETLRYWFGSDDPSEDALSKPPPSCPFLLKKVDGNVICSYTAPFLHKTMFSKQLAFGNFLLFARYMHGNRHYPTYQDDTIVEDNIVAAVKDISVKLTVAIGWQKNDLVMLDNSRFMHGRNTITDTEERLILSNFGYINFGGRNLTGSVDALWRKKKNKEFFQAMLPGI